MLGGVAEGSREDREKRYGPTENAAMRCRPETPKTKRCAVARKETMRCRFATRQPPNVRAVVGLFGGRPPCRAVGAGRVVAAADERAAAARATPFRMRGDGFSR